MDLQTLSASQVASSVWSNTTRTLTTLQGVLAAVNVNSTSLAAGATLDLRPSVYFMRDLTVSLETTTGGEISLYDGTTRFQCVTIAAAGDAGFAFAGTNGFVGAYLKNTGANAALFMYCARDFTN